MKKIFTVCLLASILMIVALTALNAQCVTSTCSTCPQITGVIPVIEGSNLWVNWNHVSCSKGIVPVINGVEYPALAGVAWPNAVTGGLVPNFNLQASVTYCIVMRSYCESPWTCAGANSIDSDPACVTAPAGLVDCKCTGTTKYLMSRPSSNGGTQQRCVNTRMQCIRMVQSGWTSSCNCQ